MKVSAIASRRFADQLAGPGVVLPCGPFVVRVKSPISQVSSGLHRLYADFDAIESDAFVDFEVRVEPPSVLRRILRPQVIFSCDGRIPFKPLPRHQAFAMLEWGLNWVVSTHAHDHLILHAAVLERDGSALLLAADPGSGKSTLCAGLVHAGWRLLSDELGLVRLDDGRVVPVARPISLKNRSIEVIRALGGLEVGEVCPDTTKGAVAHVRPPRDSVLRRGEPAMPAWLVFPKYSEGAALEVETEGKAHAFMEMVRHAFNYAFLGGDAFDALAGLVDRCEIRRVRYGHLDQVVPLLDRLARGEPR